MSQTFRGVAWAAAAAAIVLIAPFASGFATPAIPTNDDLVLEHVPQSRDPGGQALRHLAARLATEPANLDLAVQLAGAEIARGRALGDPRLVGRAATVLAPWPTNSVTPPSVLLLRAVILQFNHDFAGSLDALGRVLATDRGNAQAHLIRSAILTVQAGYAEALTECGQVAYKMLGLVPDTCTAQNEALIGRAPLALRVLSVSLQQNALQAARDKAVSLWSRTVAAEIAAALDDPITEQRFRDALAVDSTDPYLLSVWADWLLAHRRDREVVDLLADKTQTDVLLLRLALAEHALTMPQAARHIADLSDRFEAARLRGESVHRREEAMFRLHLRDDPTGALALASANWTVQREPIDARILLESAIAANRPGEAAPALAWLHDNHVQNTTLAALARRASSPRS